METPIPCAMTTHLRLLGHGVLLMQHAQSAVTAYTACVLAMYALRLSYPVQQPCQVRARRQNILISLWQNQFALKFLKFLGSVCSGNGVCGYSDPSGNNITSCTIFDYRCKASCACTNGFSGKDCTLSTIVLVQRNGVRYVPPSLPLSLPPTFLRPDASSLLLRL